MIEKIASTYINNNLQDKNMCDTMLLKVIFYYNNLLQTLYS